MKYSDTRWLLCITAVAGLLATTACEGDTDKVSLPTASAEEQPERDERPTSLDKATNPAVKPAPATVSKMRGRRFSGAFEPRRTSPVAANVGGLVRKVYVEQGNVVEDGDRLVDIDSKDYRLRVEQAEAQLEAAKAQVDMLETEYERVEQLLSKEAVAEAEVDQLSGNLASARANVSQAKVGVRMARKAQSDALIRAPFDGVVTLVSVEEGGFAAPGPQPIVQVEKVDELLLRVQIPEEYASEVEVGDTLAVDVPAIGETLEVPVTRINPVVESSSRSFDVLAEVANEDLAVRPGMFAKVTLAESSSRGTQ